MVPGVRCISTSVWKNDLFNDRDAAVAARIRGADILTFYGRSF